MTGMMYAHRPFLTKPNTSRVGIEFRQDFFRYLFLKHYKASTTWDSCITNIRDRIMQVGYTPENHTLISLSSTTDLQIFNPILNGCERTVVNTFPAIQEISLLSLARSIMPEGWPSMKLSVIHRCLCPDTTVKEYHEAWDDTLALVEVIKLILEGQR